MSTDNTQRPVPDDLVPLREAASLAGVSVHRLERWVQYGHLSSWPSRGAGRLISLAAVQTLVATPPARVESVQTAAWRSVFTAAQFAGVETHEVYRWIEDGRLSSRHGRPGLRVCLADVQALANEQRGRVATTGKTEE